ncbi:MAG: plastocyanin/azurin family copper-binding protein [Nitrososphaeraceae archaeon]
MTVFRQFSLVLFFRYDDSMKMMLYIVLVTSFILLVNWLLSFYLISQYAFAFKPTNQLGQEQREIESSLNASSEESSNVNITSHYLDLESLQARTSNITVEIVFDATLLGNKAYNPNPLIIGPNTTVSWYNADHTLHTVTSGFGLKDNNKGKGFDSPLIFSGNTYIYTFSKVGVFPYFCILHPTMIGKVIIV